MQRSSALSQAAGANPLATAVASARQAWRRGDFAACSAAIDAMSVRLTAKSTLGADALLLRSRARLRTQRPHEVVAELGPILDEFVDIDERCTARMLHAAAVARAVDAEQGLAALRELDQRAHRAHPSIRAEIAYYEALAMWTLRRYYEADLLAEKTERAAVDVLSVRAMELRGYCAFARARYDEALTFFRKARAAYETCRDRDADLVAKVIFQIANLEQTLRSSTIAGTHRLRSSRTIPDELFAQPIASMARMRTDQMDAMLHALDGDGRLAYRKMRSSEDLAPTAAWRIVALANRALLAVWFDEPLAAEQFSGIAVAEAQKIDWSMTIGEERAALLGLVEAVCVTDPETAAAVLEQYDSGSSINDALSAEPVDAIKDAWVTYIRGLVARTQGANESAVTLLASAYREFRVHGCLWRAALALVELDATPASGMSHEAFHLETAAKLVVEHFPQSFLRRRLGRWVNAYGDPIAARLTPALRQVLRYALDGYGAKEISAVTGRSVKTIGNQLAALHEAFGVRTTLRLVAECHRRGIGSPAWSTRPALPLVPGQSLKVEAG